LQRSPPRSPVVKVIKARKSSALHERIVKLFARPNGATINDLNEAGFKYSAVQALKLAERRGYKTSVVKKSGELATKRT
jgi:hypothetical protein